MTRLVWVSMFRHKFKDTLGLGRLLLLLLSRDAYAEKWSGSTGRFAAFSVLSGKKFRGIGYRCS